MECAVLQSLYHALHKAIILHTGISLTLLRKQLITVYRFTAQNITNVIPALQWRSLKNPALSLR